MQINSQSPNAQPYDGLLKQFNSTFDDLVKTVDHVEQCYEYDRKTPDLRYSRIPYGTSEMIFSNASF